MPASHTSTLIAASEPSNQCTSTQNPVVQKFMDSTESNVGPSKERKPAWNIPSRKASQELEYPIICSATWPALATNTSSRASHKSSSTASSSSTDDLKSLSDVSAVSVPPVRIYIFSPVIVLVSILCHILCEGIWSANSNANFNFRNDKSNQVGKNC